MIKRDNSEAIRRHELEERSRCRVFRPPETLSEFNALSYGEMVICKEQYPTVYDHFLRMVHERK